MKKGEFFLQEAIHLNKPPKEGLLPHFGPQPGLIYRGYHAVLIAEDELSAYAEKLVRGMSYVLDGHLLGDEYHIDLHVIKEESDQEAIKLFEGRSSIYHRGLGFLIMRIVRDDERGWIYGFNIWRKLKFYAVAHPGDIGYLKQQSSSE